MVGILSLFFVFGEVLVCLIVLMFRTITGSTVQPVASKRPAKAALAKPTQKAAEPVKKPEPVKRMELSDVQRLTIIKAILDDSLLALDSAYDALFNEGEAKFSAPDALSCSWKEYKQEYGSREWRKAWEQALADRFDCRCKYTDRGIFHIFGKEM